MRKSTVKIDRKTKSGRQSSGTRNKKKNKLNETHTASGRGWRRVEITENTLSQNRMEWKFAPRFSALFRLCESGKQDHTRAGAQLEKGKGRKAKKNSQPELSESGVCKKNSSFPKDRKESDTESGSDQLCWKGDKFSARCGGAEGARTVAQVSKSRYKGEFEAIVLAVTHQLLVSNQGKIPILGPLNSNRKPCRGCLNIILILY